MGEAGERSRSTKIHTILLTIGVLVNVAALLLLWWDGVHAPYIGKDFSYTADIVNTTNTYDPDNKRFTGTQYDTTNLQLDVTQQSGDTAVISTQRTSEDMSPRITHKRLVAVDDGRYIDSAEGQSEYVLAPRNLKKGQAFYYTPTSSDTAVSMKFTGEEVINGLKTYRYEGTQETDKQPTARLQPGPGETFRYTSKFQVWAEPSSGWIVKHKETRNANIVRSSDGQIVWPVEYTSSITSAQSVDQHIAYANSLRMKNLFVKEIAPSIFILLVLFFMITWALVRMRRPKTLPMDASLSIIVAIPTLALVGWLLGIEPLTNLFIGTSGLHPLTALCFILVALSILARRYDHWYITAFLGTCIGLTSLLQLLGSMGIINFQLDLILFDDAMLGQNGITSRMSPYESFALLMLSTLFIKSGFRTGRPPVRFVHFMTALTLILGLLGLILNFTHVNEALSIPFIQSLTVASSLLFIISGITCLQLFHRLYEREEDIRSIFKSMLWPSLAALPVVIIGIFAQLQQHTVQQNLSVNFSERISAVEASITSHIAVYTNTLTGTRGLFNATPTVTYDQWRKYVSAFQIDRDLPGLIAIGQASVDGNKVVVRYVTPESQQSLIGRDLNDDALLRETIRTAIDRDRTQLSGSIPGLNDHGGAGIFLVKPIFATDVTGPERKPQGLTFVTLDIAKFIESTTNSYTNNINFEIYRGTEINEENLLYRHQPRSEQQPRITQQSTLFSAGQAWTFAYSSEPGFQLSAEQEISPTAILLGGSAIYGGFLSVLYLLVDMNLQRKRQRQRSDKPNKNRRS